MWSNVVGKWTDVVPTMGWLRKNGCGGEISSSRQWDGEIFSPAFHPSFRSQFRYGPYIMLLSGPACQWSRVIFSSSIHKVNSISFPPGCCISTSLLIYSACCIPLRPSHSAALPWRHYKDKQTAVCKLSNHCLETAHCNSDNICVLTCV